MANVHEELEKRINDLRVEIQASQRLLTELEKLRAVLGPSSSTRPIRTRHARPPGTPPDTKTVPESVQEAILGLLEKAGKRGLTARDVAERLDVPTGTASSRLSIMKAEGVITHEQPYYFFPGPKATRVNATETASGEIST